VPTPEQTRKGLVLITSAAVDTASRLVKGSADATRNALTAATPEIVAYYSEGSAALAADHYDDLRDEARAAGRYVAEPIVELREEKIRTGVLWSVEPLYRPEPDDALALERLAQVVQYETARPFRETVTINSRRDPASVGWQRISSGGCKFCRMLAGRGAVYKETTARFASHPHCGCTAAPVFDGQPGPEASTIQYVASRRKRSPADRARVREYLASMPD
jgi:hypothetical protein